MRGLLVCRRGEVVGVAGVVGRLGRIGLVLGRYRGSVQSRIDGVGHFVHQSFPAIGGSVLEWPAA